MTVTPDTRLRREAPLDRTAELELTGRVCPGCGVGFVAGDVTTHVPIGPGASRQERDRCRRGEPYESVSIRLHWPCATGDTYGEAFPVWRAMDRAAR